mgnify:CR=1 FL=1
MKKKFLYVALFALTLASCSDQEIIEQPSTPTGGTEVQLPADVTSGELLIKFKPEMTDILDQTMTRATRSGGAMTRSGIPSTDEVLEILGGYHFERIFPVDQQNEERTRAAGLHLWYLVKFDENTDLQEAANRLSKLGEISKVQGNSRIRRAYSGNYRTYTSEAVLQKTAATRTLSTAPNDPGFVTQWNLNNVGDIDFGNSNAKSVTGCDVNCLEAWKKCTGDPSIIVAVLDEGVMYTHPDLAANMWVNEKEQLRAGKDADGNGYKDDRYGYNFVKNSGGLEGIMIMGALGGALTMRYVPNTVPAIVMILAVIVVSALVGMVYSCLLAVASINFKADQTLVGTALNLLGTAGATVIVKAINTAANPDDVSSIVQYGSAKNALLAPIGSFEFNWFMLVAFIALVFAYVTLYKTRFGLRLMACGEHPQAAASVGINVYKMRWAGVLISGVLGGIGGIVFITAGVSEWRFEYGVAGFGFLSLAVMIFGQWKPQRIALAALLFGFFRALGNVYTGFSFLKAMNLPSSLYNMLPYIISLIVLAFTSKNSRAPKAEGIPYDKGMR